MALANDHPAIEHRVNRGPTAILGNRERSQERRGGYKEDEVETRPNIKEGHIKIGGLLDQERIMGVLRLHPFPERRTYSEQWNKEQRHDRKKATHIFQLPADDDAPLGIHRMMDQRPEESSHADGQEKRVGKEIGESELLRDR